MKKVAGVRFHKGGRIYFFDPGELDVSKGDMVIVDTSFGQEAGEVATLSEMGDSGFDKNLMTIVRVFNEEDKVALKKRDKNREKFLDISKQLVKEHGLEMRMLDVNFSFDDSKVTFIFSSESRIDFRQLVKDLSSKIRRQVVLRQIGPRDEARLLGGYGRCGRPFCCQTFLQNLESITMDMAKDQGLAIKGSSKISGVCGKLMCCLSYEVEVYRELVKNLPKIGDKVKLKKGSGTVIDQNIIKQTVLVSMEKTGVILEAKLDELEQ